MATAYDQQQRRQPSAISSFVRWLKLKNYQYEVTFSLYMLSPTERVIFNVIILMLFSLLVTAASMYLPDHVHQIYTRIWYYVHGNTASAAQAVKATVDGMVQSTKSLTSTIPAETAAEMLKKLKEL